MCYSPNQILILRAFSTACIGDPMELIAIFVKPYTTRIPFFPSKKKRPIFSPVVSPDVRPTLNTGCEISTESRFLIISMVHERLIGSYDNSSNVLSDIPSGSKFRKLPLLVFTSEAMAASTP
ncbi:16859_t:CDS:2 [Funneliformis caledonium]|uniref:16859_t:CDS:1 n=1 Tax=Funneliformis caledonium TaxID=1117310 RepID=A0A9N8VU43_9GLOM|nr:16859_t:CDS:2 [Funneliformis caledonium]